jgi:hypothetical protein
MIFSHEYERMVECDTVHKITGKNKFELRLYKDDKLIEDPRFKSNVVVFIMEKGKTIDRIDFTIDDK